MMRGGAARLRPASGDACAVARRQPGEQAVAQGRHVLDGVQAVGAPAHRREELGGWAERVGDDAVVGQRQGSGRLAVKLADENRAREGRLGVQRGEAVQVGGVGLVREAKDMAVGGVHGYLRERESARRGSARARERWHPGCESSGVVAGATRCG